jgi:hypothetical protein
MAKAAKGKPKTPSQSSRRTPKHGRGELQVGNPGNRGGTGRPPSAVRARCLGSFDERIHVAEEIASSAQYEAGDRLRALDLLGKYAGLQKVEHTGEDSAPIRFTLDLGKAAIDGGPTDGGVVDGGD